MAPAWVSYTSFLTKPCTVELITLDKRQAQLPGAEGTPA